MKIEIVDRGSVTIVRPEDRLDIVGYLELEECLGGLLARRRSRLVLDLVEATFINSTALSVINRFWVDCSRAGGVLVIARPTREARNFLRICAVDELIDIFDGVEQAVTAAAGRKAPARAKPSPEQAPDAEAPPKSG